MGFLDRLLGREPLSSSRTGAPAPRDGSLPPPSGQPYAVPAPSGGASEEDERAIARYKYLLRTAPPEAIEQVHREAFEKLTQEQRQQVLQRMSADLPEAERPTRADPAELARAATRAEMRQPGYLPQAFGGGGMGMGRGGMGMGGMGMGGMFAGSMLGTIAGVVVGSAIADAMMGGFDDSPEAAAAADTGDPAGDSGDSGADTGADTGADSGVDYAGDGGGDLGSDFGGGFGDFGGGDFGGGDFGGGDF